MKARQAFVRLAGLEFTRDVGATCGAFLYENLLKANSVIPLAYALFSGDPDAADVYIGTGAAATLVVGSESAVAPVPPVMASVSRSDQEEVTVGDHARRVVGEVGGGGECVLPATSAAASSSRDAAYGGVRLNWYSATIMSVQDGVLRLGPESRDDLPSLQPISKAPCPWRADSYQPFCSPRNLAPTTAHRNPISLRSAGLEAPVAVVVQAYERLANDCPQPDLYVRAGDLLGQVGTNLLGEMLVRKRNIDDAIRAAAIAATQMLAQIESRGGPLPRLEASFWIPHRMTLQDALSFAVTETATIFRTGLGVTPLSPVLQYMSSCMSSLFALHYAALQAVERPVGGSSLADLASYIYLRKTSGIMRSLACGVSHDVAAKENELGRHFGAPPAGLLPPPPVHVERALGMRTSPCRNTTVVDGRSHGSFLSLPHSEDIRSDWSTALKTLYATKFVCFFGANSGAPCGRQFSSSDMLHQHLRDCRHSCEPPSGGFITEPKLGIDIVENYLRDLSEEQRQPILRFITTGRSVMVSGTAGAGKTVCSRAVFRILRALFGDEAVLWITPTKMSAQVADAAARTIQSAAGLGIPSTYDTVNDLVQKSLRQSKSKNRLSKLRFLLIDEIWRIPYREFKALLDAREQVNTCALQLWASGDAGQMLDWSRRNLAAKVLEEVPAMALPMTNFFASLRCLVIELTEVHRQVDGEFVQALRDIRGGQEWKSGESAYDFFEKHCSTATRGNEGLFEIDRTDDNREYPSLQAVHAGYVTLVAKNEEVKKIAARLYDAAKNHACGQRTAWREILVVAQDGKRDTHTGRVRDWVIASDVDGSGAPATLRIYTGAVVMVAHTTTAINEHNESVELPPGLQGVVTAVEGTSLDTFKVSVRFAVSDHFPVATTHSFEAVIVDEPDDLGGYVNVRRTIQLRDGSCMTYHRAQALTIPRVIADLYSVQGADFAKGLIFTGTSRGMQRAFTMVLNRRFGQVFANVGELAWVADQVAATQALFIEAEMHESTPVVVRDIANFLSLRVRGAEPNVLATALFEGMLPTTLAEPGVEWSDDRSRQESGHARAAGTKRRRDSAACSLAVGASERAPDAADLNSVPGLPPALEALFCDSETRTSVANDGGGCPPGERVCETAVAPTQARQHGVGACLTLDDVLVRPDQTSALNSKYGKFTQRTVHYCSTLGTIVSQQLRDILELDSQSDEDTICSVPDLGHTLRRHDVNTLRPGIFLNDTILNRHFTMLQKRDDELVSYSDGQLQPALVLNTYFMRAAQDVSTVLFMHTRNTAGTRYPLTGVV